RSLYQCRAPVTPVIDTRSLHDALPISEVEVALLVVVEIYCCEVWIRRKICFFIWFNPVSVSVPFKFPPVHIDETATHIANIVIRSEEHTSELQSRFDLVCRLLLEKKNI